MSCETDKYRLLFAKMPDAFAYHQVIYDQQGRAVDYLFLEINDAFEAMTGLKREQVIGKKVTEVHPDISESDFDWIGVYGQVAMEGESTRFEQYFEPADCWYDVSAFSDAPGYFAVSFREVTIQKNENLALTKLVGLAQRSMQNPAEDFSYQAFSDGLLELSGAKFAAINIYEQNNRKTVTKAISGIADGIRRACELLGYELTGKTWDMIPERLNAIKEGRLLHFANLYDAASGVIPKKISTLLEKVFGIGEVYVAEVNYEGETIGDLIMFMPRHKTLANPQVIELYAAQVGFTMARNLVEEAMRESREQYRSLVDNIPGTSYRCLYDQDWTMLYMSSDVDNMTGYPSSDFINNKRRSYASVICQDDNDNDEIIRVAIEAGETWDIEYRVIHSDGSIRWVHEKGRGVMGEDGNVAYIDGLIIDITDRKQVEKALKESEMRSRALVGAIPDLLFCYSNEGVYLDAVVKDEKLLHEKARQLYRQQVLVGKTISEVLPAPIVSIVKEGIEKALASGEIIVLEYNYLVNGNHYYFEARLAPIGTTEVVSIVRDITERKKYEAELQQISFHDKLTGLYNRHYYENELKRLNFSREHPIAVIVADIDNLKLVNDTLGHSEGDKYIKAGAELLKSTLRKSDILARVGGDEFAIILPRLTPELGRQLVERIFHQVEEYNRKQTSSLPLSISIGIAVSESSEHSLEDTYIKADRDMYADKLQRGKKAGAMIVTLLLNSLHKRSDLSEGEREQVQELCLQLGQALSLDSRRMDDLKLLSTAYDLGKVSLPDHIVHSNLRQKKGELTKAEREAIYRHPETGYRIASSSPELVHIADLIMKHHENWDGSGYPLGLKGEEIPIECRIVALAIAYSAMTNPRPYAKIFDSAEAIEELKRCAGIQFDPELVKIFTEIITDKGK